MRIPAALESLVQELARLPGVGRKTAQRLTFHLMRAPAQEAQTLSTAIREAREQIRFCTRCAGYAEAELCALCPDPGRDRHAICVIEQPQDLYVIEHSGAYKGLYHVLMGCLSPIDGVGPQQLRIAPLLERIRREEIREVILATNPSMAGEATALHIGRLLSTSEVRVSRLAQGMPVGAQLEFTDAVTLQQAFHGRQSFRQGNPDS